VKTYNNSVFPPEKIRWEIDDLYDDWPLWSCYCILNCDLGGNTQPEDVTGYRAWKYCEVCEGHGFMPIPPSEVLPETEGVSIEDI
jgi:hypothetical protein